MVNSPEEEAAKAKVSVYRLLKFRARSRKEIIDRLRKKGFQDKVIQKTIDYFSQLNYINDKEFTSAWINSRIAKPLGPQRVFFELRQKGINKEIIDQAWNRAKKGYREFEIVSKIAKNKFKSFAGLDKNKAKRRIYGYLFRRGFSGEIIQEVVGQL